MRTPATTALSGLRSIHSRTRRVRPRRNSSTPKTSSTTRRSLRPSLFSIAGLYRPKRALAEARQGDDRSTQDNRHRKGQTVCSGREDNGDLEQRRGGSERVVDGMYDAGFPPFFPSSRWAVPASGAGQSRFVRIRGNGHLPCRRPGAHLLHRIHRHQTPRHGQTYLIASKDSDGDALEGDKEYRLHVPPSVPVEQYWSVTAYDRETHALIKNMPRASRASPPRCRKMTTARSTSTSVPRRWKVRNRTGSDRP
jgi:hypothetical protein